MKYRTPFRFLLEGVEGTCLFLIAFCTWPVSRRWLRDWGSHAQERGRAWPGDELVSVNHETSTRGIDISAPASHVWPWVLQFGLGRAGFYSYELLERLVGIPVKNVESIVPALQRLSVGDEILLHPKAPGIPVALLEPDRHICFGVLPDSGPSDARTDPRRSWSIYIEPTADDACRLLLRGCIEPLRKPSWAKRFSGAIGAPIDFVMEQRMLRTITRLAEPASSER